MFAVWLYSISELLNVLESQAASCSLQESYLFFFKEVVEYEGFAPLWIHGILQKFRSAELNDARD